MRKYVKNPVRSFGVEETDTNKVRLFDNVSVYSGGLTGFSDVVHDAYQLPPIKKVNLTWFSETDPFYIGNDDEFFEMWDKGVVEVDGYIHLYMNVTNMRVPLSDEFPSRSCLSVSKSLYSTPEKVKSTSRLHIERGATPVNLDPATFLTPKKRILYSESPELLRRNPRLLKKSIGAVIGILGNVSGKKLFFNVDDDEVVDAEISDEVRQLALEYENIQLENNEPYVCHPIDDCRSPVADDAELGIAVYTDFVNNYFDGMDYFDFLYPQLYRKKGNADEASNDNNCGVTEEYDPKGKAPIVDVPSDADISDTSSGSDSEDDEGILSVQVLAEDDGNETVWVNQYEKVWGEHVEAAEKTN
ncbi:uncharacterized protein LOC113285786 [Papaver somniferum]|uniref:uncharacterized protein LOC113285786 n=1 Tax=Papaver somniferum TaxID=3469 RepID=UPI000E6F800E|nr:uncharacterized protein LOC113285786 [Papaver somniferum]